MKSMARFGLLLISFLGVAYGQQATASRAAGHTGGSGTIGSLPAGSIINGGDAGVFYSTSTSNCGYLTANGLVAYTACSGGPPYEKRVDDGKGPTLMQVKSSARRLESKELPPAEYISLVKSVGLDGPVADESKILGLIDSLALHVYDFDKVDGYLYRKAVHAGTNVRWVWKPVRQVDAKALAGNAYRVVDHVGMASNAQYAQKIPVRILQLMKSIECEFPGVVFAISDYEVVKPDPFLMITSSDLIAAGKMWIVAQWDEPGFTDGPEFTASR